MYPAVVNLFTSIGVGNKWIALLILLAVQIIYGIYFGRTFPGKEEAMLVTGTVLVIASFVFLREFGLLFTIFGTFIALTVGAGALGVVSMIADKNRESKQVQDLLMLIEGFLVICRKVDLDTITVEKDFKKDFHLDYLDFALLEDYLFNYASFKKQDELRAWFNKVYAEHDRTHDNSLFPVGTIMDMYELLKGFEPYDIHLQE